MLQQAKDSVKTWVDASGNLSRNAAQARANNQSAGRGFMGAILGSKFRGAMRSAAAASNATIAKEVAGKRARIAEGKREAQEVVRRIQAEIESTKQELKSAHQTAKATAKAARTTASKTKGSIDLLHKLKEAYDLGLLTAEEFESKRKKLADEL
jgi:hypothetical protein